MTELNETLENKDSEKEDLIPENNNLSDKAADADENPFFCKKTGCQLQNPGNCSLKLKD